MKTYLKDYRDLAELELGVSRWIEACNHHRIHQALGYQILWSIYSPQSKLAEAD